MGSESLTVCVTGASGFIGSWLVMSLIQRGYTVRATVIDPGSSHSLNSSFSSSSYPKLGLFVHPFEFLVSFYSQVFKFLSGYLKCSSDLSLYHVNLIIDI